MERSVMMVLVVVAAGGGLGCQTPEWRPFPVRFAPPPPPAWARGSVRDLTVSPQLGNRQFGQRLAAEVRELRDRNVSVVRLVSADNPYYVIAWAAICREQPPDSDAARAFDDGQLVLAHCLNCVENWVTPKIEVSIDAEGKQMLACAAFTRCSESEVKANRCQQAYRSLSGVPIFFVAVEADAPDSQRIVQKGMALYLMETSRDVTPQPAAP